MKTSSQLLLADWLRATKRRDRGTRTANDPPRKEKGRGGKAKDETSQKCHPGDLPQSREQSLTSCQSAHLACSFSDEACCRGRLGTVHHRPRLRCFDRPGTYRELALPHMITPGTNVDSCRSGDAITERAPHVRGKRFSSKPNAGMRPRKSHKTENSNSRDAGTPSDGLSLHFVCMSGRTGGCGHFKRRLPATRFFFITLCSLWCLLPDSEKSLASLIRLPLT